MSAPSDPRAAFRRLVLPLIFAVVAAASATAAIACSCVNWQTPQAQLDQMDVAVIARPVWTRREVDGEAYDGVTLFTVERTLKGEARQQWRIAHLVDHNGPTCGVAFRPGERILLMATMHQGRLMTSACHGALFPIAAYERAVAARR